jgi:hypothetical protein
MHPVCNHFLHCSHCIVSSAAEYSWLDSPHPSQSTCICESHWLFCSEWHGRRGGDGDGVSADVVAADSGEIVMLTCSSGEGSDADGTVLGLGEDCDIVIFSCSGGGGNEVATNSGYCCGIVTLAGGGDKDNNADGGVVGWEDNCGIVVLSRSSGISICDGCGDGDREDCRLQSCYFFNSQLRL